jgi:hypothetical protein
MSDAVIAEGRQAWQAIKGQGKVTFEAWTLVGRALIAGRTACMQRAKVNTPYSPAYQREIRQWLKSNDLEDLDVQERRGSIWMAEHEAEIERWRSGLSDVARRLANHPNTIAKHFHRKSAPQKSGPKKGRHIVTPARPASNGGGRAIHWDQAAIRRGADAMREARSNDLFILARKCLEAACPNEGTLMALLPAPAAPARAPAQTAEVGEHAHAIA